MSDDNDGVGTTENRLLGGRVVMRQPSAGYRVAVDPVFLASVIDISDKRRRRRRAIASAPR